MGVVRDVCLQRAQCVLEGFDASTQAFDLLLEFIRICEGEPVAHDEQPAIYVPQRPHLFDLFPVVKDPAPRVSDVYRMASTRSYLRGR